MPLTEYQSKLAKLLASNRSPDSFLAGGAALHLSPNSNRYSNDLDFFNDSVERVASAFDEDSTLLDQHSYQIEVLFDRPGFIRALVSKGKETTKVEWVHDSAWRFLPVVEDEECGYKLHPIDLAINKLLALVGREEPRDFLDIIQAHQHILSLDALCWAACGKDPGFTPSLLLELLKRRGRYTEDDFSRLRLTKMPDIKELKSIWLNALVKAEETNNAMGMAEPGCLFYSLTLEKFVSPMDKDAKPTPHFGRPGGVWPSVRDD
jgi:hypothetical protein